MYPHVFLIDPTPLAPNDEVEELFTVPIADLLKQTPERIPIPLRPEPPEDFPYERIAGGRNYPFRTAKLPELFYEHEGRHIWDSLRESLNIFSKYLTKKTSEQKFTRLCFAILSYKSCNITHQKALLSITINHL
ncbi:hypothetical protein [Geomicrobium sp. JCM 19037]|uniref:hypothetical protein n=1 Tax=Geomicrobium sp. JCM 19037 TaxID=1460634 RepID=UPI00187BCBDB|nr:hypothetical protein [Geomicrobium sp. JCM 19037]